MNREQLIKQIHRKQSFLCVGLDTEMEKLPAGIPRNADGILQFNKAIIDATREYCVAYKPNLAFYEALGPVGWEILQETVSYIGSSYLTIADAKRGDIGNTAEQYARSIFEKLGFDAVTVAPYMGRDSVMPFLSYAGKWTIALGLTSNPGHGDFQTLVLQNGRYLYEEVIDQLCSWGSPDQLMLVIGATRADHMEKVRSMAPNHFWLVPGVGAQGGSLTDVWTSGANRDIGLLVNSSRAIQYASGGEDFREAAGEAAKQIMLQMSAYVKPVN